MSNVPALRLYPDEATKLRREVEKLTHENNELLDRIFELEQANKRLAKQINPTMRDAVQALLLALRSFSDAQSDSLSDQRWHFEVLPAMRALDAAEHAEEAEHEKEAA